MAQVEDFATLFGSTLTLQCLNTATTATVATTAGLPANPHQFRMRLEPAGGSTTQFEIALCQVNSATLLNFIDPATGSTSVNGRGLEGTTAQTWPSGSLVTAVITAGGLLNMGPSGTFASLKVGSNTPGLGTLATGTVAADGATSGTTELTVMTAAAATTGTGRRILITTFIWDYTGTVPGDVFEIRHKEGATILNGLRLRVQTGTPAPGLFQTMLTPTAAAHTYSTTLIRTSGTGVLNFGATTYPAWMRVDDVGV